LQFQSKTNQRKKVQFNKNRNFFCLSYFFGNLFFNISDYDVNKIRIILLHSVVFLQSVSLSLGSKTPGKALLYKQAEFFLGSHFFWF
jgi:hypothetical protein